MMLEEVNNISYILYLLKAYVYHFNAAANRVHSISQNYLIYCSSIKTATSASLRRLPKCFLRRVDWIGAFN
jgi:hypothetical protein